jgi:beta-lactam-binding protein with PASTA domain
MPDVRGLGAREALRTLAAHGLAPRLVGTGIVTAQTPEPGEPVDAATTSTLVLGRRAERAVAAPSGTSP